MIDRKIRITIQGIVVTIIKSMDMLLRITIEHISEVTTIDGWVKVHASVIWRLVTSTKNVQQGQRNLAVNSINEQDMEEKGRLQHIKFRWGHFIQWIKWSHHPQLGNQKICGTDISMIYFTWVLRI